MGVRPSASPTSSVPSSIKIGLSLRPDSWRGVVGATVYGIYFIMATRPLGYLLPALSGSLKYGDVSTVCDGVLVCDGVSTGCESVWCVSWVTCYPPSLDPSSMER